MRIQQGLWLTVGVMLAWQSIFVCATRAADTENAKVSKDAPPAIKALMITGGCCHDYPKQKEILAKGISARARVEWKIVHVNTKKRDVKVPLYQQKDWAKGYDVVVHNECFGGVTDVKFVEGIAKAHYDGVACVIIHCSVHSYRNAKTDEWRKCVGMSSFSHEKHRPVLVKNLKPDHPIMKGFPAEWQTPNGELYKESKLWPNAVALGNAFGKDTKKNHTCIWVNTYGKGKVFATTLGHHNETMSHDVYQDLVTRGLLWSVGKLNDDGKPAKGYEVAANAKSKSPFVVRQFGKRQIIIGTADSIAKAKATHQKNCQCGNDTLGKHFVSVHQQQRPDAQEQADSPDLR